MRYTNMNSNNKRKPADVKITIGSANVFADLGVLNPEEALAKAQLASQIYDLVKSSRLTQSQAAKKLGIDQPKVSALLRGRLAGFSIERLFHFLNKLGQDIHINIRPSDRRIPAIHGQTRKSA